MNDKYILHITTVEPETLRRMQRAIRHNRRSIGLLCVGMSFLAAVTAWQEARIMRLMENTHRDEMAG